MHIRSRLPPARDVPSPPRSSAHLVTAASVAIAAVLPSDALAEKAPPLRRPAISAESAAGSAAFGHADTGVELCLARPAANTSLRAAQLGMAQLTRSDDAALRCTTPQTEAAAVAARCDDRARDADIAARFGVTATGKERDALTGFDSFFTGAGGEQARMLVLDVARELQVDVGLLAANMCAELTPQEFLAPGEIDNERVGLDMWQAHAKEIERRLGRLFAGDHGVFEDKNEHGVSMGKNFNFVNGREALRAVAAWLVVLEQRLEEKVGSARWHAVPRALRNALIRLSFNPGQNKPLEIARALADDVAAGRDPMLQLRTQGPGGPKHPLRAATIRAAQALHLSQSVLERDPSCPAPAADTTASHHRRKRTAPLKAKPAHANANKKMKMKMKMQMKKAKVAKAKAPKHKAPLHARPRP